MTTHSYTMREAVPKDVNALVRLINAAFMVERFFIDRDRIDAETVKKIMGKGRFIIAEDDAVMAACIFVELRGERGYFGLLSVDPTRQKTGLGRKMITAAEDYFRSHGCIHSDMRIVNVREELPGFYARLGYTVTGTASFEGPVDPLVPCHFILYSKPLV